jgi:CRP/FNR family cyclic AMP-dependent transcriptional regulator
VIERFKGDDGKKRLIEALRLQELVSDEEDLARALADIVNLETIEANTPLFIEGSEDADLFLIISGDISVRVNGREVERRGNREFIGELALLNPSAKHNAEALATKNTLVARIGDIDFSNLAEKHPRLWRRIALKIADRLRARARFVQIPNLVPELFIGSSSEGLPVAKEICSGLSNSSMKIFLWSEKIFQASQTFIESLMQAVQRSDFAILVLTADDSVDIRTRLQQSPRDNCVFELGLFMGALGRDRTFIVRSKGDDIRIPSDLLGVTALEYVTAESIQVGPACEAVRDRVAKLGPK